jgi:hypothetical protein
MRGALRQGPDDVIHAFTRHRKFGPVLLEPADEIGLDRWRPGGVDLAGRISSFARALVAEQVGVMRALGGG